MIIEDCKKVKEGRAIGSIYSRISELRKMLPLEYILEGDEYLYSTDFRDRIVKWHKRAQIHAFAPRAKTKSEEEASIPREQPSLLPSESVQMPQSADSMLIQISESNRKYLKSIEMAGGSPDAFINRLIDSYRL